MGRETTSMAPPASRVNKYGFELSDEQIGAGKHRAAVGGRWRQLGQLQFDFLRAHGLAASSYLLDVGCGSMRGGVYFARYLDPGHYYGVDVNDSLIRAARSREIPEAGLADRVPETNLRVTDRFDVDFGVRFDFALAVSLFTHLPLNHIRLCLYQVSKVMQPGGRFYATFFEAPQGMPLDESMRHPKVKASTRSERDPFHYRRSDLEWAARSAGPWNPRYLGEWGHPKGQQMIELQLARPPRARTLPVAQVPRRAVRRVRRYAKTARKRRTP